MRRIPLREQVVFSLFLTVILHMHGCGASDVLKSFRVALASSGPLVNSLVAAGAIPQGKATAIVTDFNDGATCGLTLSNAFAAIPKDIPEQEQTSRKLNASVAGLRCFRAVIQRQNFASNPRVQNVANIAEGILASLVVFYSEPGEMRASASPSATVTARNEKDLEAQLKTQVEALKAAMKP